MWDLVPQAEVEAAPPPLEARSLNHWPTREAPLSGLCSGRFLYHHIRIWLLAGTQ